MEPGPFGLLYERQILWRCNEWTCKNNWPIEYNKTPVHQKLFGSTRHSLLYWLAYCENSNVFIQKPTIPFYLSILPRIIFRCIFHLLLPERVQILDMPHGGPRLQACVQIESRMRDRRHRAGTVLCAAMFQSPFLPKPLRSAANPNALATRLRSGVSAEHAVVEQSMFAHPTPLQPYPHSLRRFCGWRVQRRHSFEGHSRVTRSHSAWG